MIPYPPHAMHHTQHTTVCVFQEEEVARPFPSVCEPRSKRRRSDSPLEEAIIKDLIEDMEVESKVPMIG